MKKLLAIALALVSCAAAAELTYEAELGKCVDDARSRDESHACRARVNEKWNVHLDGGADGNAE